MPMKVELTNFRTIYMEKSQNHRPFPGTRIGGSFARGCPFFYMEKSQYQSLLESEKKKNRITKTMVRMRNFNNIHPSAEILTMRRLKLELELQSYQSSNISSIKLDLIISIAPNYHELINYTQHPNFHLSQTASTASHVGGLSVVN